MAAAAAAARRGHARHHPQQQQLLLLLLLLSFSLFVSLATASTVAPSSALHCWAHNGVFCQPNICVASYEDDAVSLYRQAGAPGAYSSHKEVLATVAKAVAVVAVDVNGDGHQDILSLSQETGAAVWHDVHADESHAIASAAPGDASALAVADLDGDGRPDVVMAGPEPATIVWYKNYAGSFFNASEPRLVHNGTALGLSGQLLVADVDSDGLLDVMSVTESVGIEYYARVAGGGGGFDPLRNVVSTRGYRVALADLDGDGRVDIVSAPWDNNELTWFANMGFHPIPFGPEQTISTAMTLPNHVQVASGTNDLLVGTPYALFFLRHRSSAVFDAPERLASVDEMRGIVIADLDFQDVPADVAFVSERDDGVRVVLSSGPERGAYGAPRSVSDESDAPRAVTIVFQEAVCPAGWFCDALSHMPRPCAAGEWSGGGASVCATCDAGKFSAQTGSSACETCPPNYFQGAQGQSVCQTCAPGTYTALNGSQSCAPCPEGGFVCAGDGRAPYECAIAWQHANEHVSECVDRCFCHPGAAWIVALIATVFTAAALIPSRPAHATALVLLGARHVKACVDWAYVLLHVYASNSMQAFLLVVLVAHVVFAIVSRVMAQQVLVIKLGLAGSLPEPAKMWHMAAVGELGLMLLHMLMQVINNAQTRWEGIGAAAFVLFFVTLSLHWRTYAYLWLVKRTPLAKLPFSMLADDDEEEEAAAEEFYGGGGRAGGVGASGYEELR